MNKEELASIQERERRRFFRMDDRVGLRLVAILPGDEARVVASIEDPGTRAGLSDELRAIRDIHLPERRSLEYKFPTVAAYVKVLEKQIELLALVLGNEDGFSMSPDTLVNLSGQGLCLEHPEGFPIGARLEIRLTLFPDRSHFKAIGQVMRCDAEAGSHRIGLDFVHLREADREAIIRHVHMLQRLQLQASAEEALEASYRGLEATPPPASKSRLTKD